MRIAIVLAGGNGTRLGLDTPKQYISVGGKMIITYCLQTLVECEMVDGILLVIQPEMYEEVIRDMEEAHISYDKMIGYALPGETRQLSIYNGLCRAKEFAGDGGQVLIHDAARPNLTGGMIRECFNGLETHDGIMPVIPMKDTVYLSENGENVSSLLDRSKIFAGQAPEAFVLDKYLGANEALLPEVIKSINGSSEPAIMFGLDVGMIPGDEKNYKITTAADLDSFRVEIENR